MARLPTSQVVIRLLTSPVSIFTVSMVTRVAVFWQVFPGQGTANFYRYNEQARIAWALVSGYGFSSPWLQSPLVPTAQQPPLYPWLLAGIFRIAGSYTAASLASAVFLNAIFASLAAVLIFHLGKRTFGTLTGTAAAWIWAIWLYEAVVSMRLWESSLSCLLLLLGLWLYLRLDGAYSISTWSAFGVLAGVSALSNTTSIAVFVGWCGWILIQRMSWRRVQGVLIALFFCVVTLLPWTVRNYVQFHQFVPVRDNFGFELAIGNHEDSVGEIHYDTRGEIGLMNDTRQVAMDFILAHPWRFLRSCGYRIFRFWTDPWKRTWLPISLLAWIGCMLAFRKIGQSAVPYAIPLMIFPIAYYVTHPGATYRHPIEPEILILAVFAVVTSVNWGIARGFRRIR